MESIWTSETEVQLETGITLKWLDKSVKWNMSRVPGETLQSIVVLQNETALDGANMGMWEEGMIMNWWKDIYTVMFCCC